MDKYKTVEEYLDGLDSDRRAQVLKLRQYILEVNPSLEEQIKWNAPSYALGGEDRLTFNTMNKEKVVKLVFHMGATRKENKKGGPILREAPVVKWVSDIRGYASFDAVDEIHANKESIKRTISDWLTVA